MATFRNEQEYQQFNRKLNSRQAKKQEYWIGAKKDPYHKGSHSSGFYYVNSDGNVDKRFPLGDDTFARFAYGEPNNYNNGNENCVVQCDDQKSWCIKEWNDSPCNFYKGVVCEKRTGYDDGPASQIVPVPSCQGKVCYNFYPDKKNFKDTAKFCKTKAMKMAAIKSKDEQTTFLQKMDASPHKQSYWLGGTIDTYQSGDHKNKFYWVDGLGKGQVDRSSSLSGSYTRWQEGEPNNYEGKEGCVEFCDGSVSWCWKNFWNDINCNELSGVVCEQRNW